MRAGGRILVLPCVFGFLYKEYRSMSQSNRQLHLNAFLWGVGQHEASCRHPLTTASDVISVAHYQNLGRIAERGKLDSLFFADALQVDSRIKHNPLFLLDPVTLLSAIAVATERIGL